MLYLHEVLFELRTMYAHYMNTKKDAMAMYRFRNLVEPKDIISKLEQAVSQK